jgi:hypothetical protein
MCEITAGGQYGRDERSNAQAPDACSLAVAASRRCFQLRALRDETERAAAATLSESQIKLRASELDATRGSKVARRVLTHPVPPVVGSPWRGPTTLRSGPGKPRQSLTTSPASSARTAVGA